MFPANGFYPGPAPRRDQWNAILRLTALLAAPFLWYGGNQFSVDGFNFQVPDRMWLAWVLSITVTILELIFAHKGRQLPLEMQLLCGLAYTYGIGTNVVGVWTAQGEPDVSRNPALGLMPGILGIVLDLAPEWMVRYGLGMNEGGVLEKLLNLGGELRGGPAESSGFEPSRADWPPVPHSEPVRPRPYPEPPEQTLSPQEQVELLRILEALPTKRRQELAHVKRMRRKLELAREMLTREEANQ